MKSLRNKPIFEELLSAKFIKFCLVGCANVGVDFIIYICGLAIGISPYPSRIISWIGACLFSYLLNRAWTFKAADRGLAPLIRYGLINIISLGLGLILLYLFITLGCGEKTAYLLALPFTTLANFIGYRFWAFKKIS